MITCYMSLIFLQCIHRCLQFTIQAVKREGCSVHVRHKVQSAVFLNSSVAGQKNKLHSPCILPSNMQVSPTSYPPVQQYPPTQQYVQTQPYMVSPHQQYMPMQGYPQTQVQYVTIPMGGGAPVAFAPGMVQMQPGVPGTQVVQQAPMKRPPMETVNRLVSARGAMVWQETRIGTVVADVMDVAYAARNKYRISALPQDKSVKSDPDDPKGWTPTEREFTSMETLIKAKEDSDCMVRILTMWCGCGNLRPMKIHYDVPDSGEAYTVIRCGFVLRKHECTFPLLSWAG